MKGRINNVGKGMKNYSSKDLIAMYKNRNNYHLLSELDHVDDKKRSKVVGLPFFNGMFARNFLRGNATEGWMDIAALNDAGLFGPPISSPFYTDKTGKELMHCRIKGEVILIKCDHKGIVQEKLIMMPTDEQVKKIANK